VGFVAPIVSLETAARLKERNWLKEEELVEGEELVKGEDLVEGGNVHHMLACVILGGECEDVSLLDLDRVRANSHFANGL
jgi:hypothetical protein